MHIHTIQLNIETLEGGCQDMDATEFGAYMSLIICCYKSNNKLKDDDSRLARMAKVSPRIWKKIKPILTEKFTISDGVWSHERVRKELLKYHKLSQKNKANALKNKETGEPVACQSHSQTRANTSNNKQITNNNKLSKDSSTSILEEAVNKYNSIGLAKVQKLSQSRKSKLSQRLKDCGGMEGWVACLEKVKSSDFLMGRTKNWRADFDFIITDNKFIKIMEGAYDNQKSNKLENQAKELIGNDW